MIVVCIFIRDLAGLDSGQLSKGFHHALGKPRHRQAVKAGDTFKDPRERNGAVRFWNRPLGHRPLHDQCGHFWRNFDRLLHHIESFARMVVDIETNHFWRNTEMYIIAFGKARVAP